MGKIEKGGKKGEENKGGGFGRLKKDGEEEKGKNKGGRKQRWWGWEVEIGWGTEKRDGEPRTSEKKEDKGRGLGVK